MKKLFLFIFLLASVQSFGQTPSKQEIMDWICGKLIKYAQRTCAPGLKINEIRKENHLLLISASDSRTPVVLHEIVKINFENLSSFNLNWEYNHYSCFLLEGKDLTNVRWWGLDGKEDNYSGNSIDFANIDWNMEEDLQNRMKKALTDLIAILKKERQDKKELY